ncbi:MAG: hypothetical protein A2516_08855 [Alphaproteobacteria bacterium RIFOXYD12_FULL_60_8]|nr:MAG: hypothetical protein A2516_08855 [Alphaproteobacteria bacterium RIFOXYD12_FULL_60_8]
MTTRRVLIVTIPPYEGGVPTKARILARHLQRLGHDVTVAHYAVLSREPELCAPCWSWRTPALRAGTVFDGVPSVAVGCRFPELEFPYYHCSALWRKTIAAYDRHIAVGGNILVSNLLHESGVKHMTWAGTPFFEDRQDRQATMPVLRKLVDRVVLSPLLARLEHRLLTAGAPILCVSRYTRRRLQELGGRADRLHHVPVPVDLDLFFPPTTPASAGVIGFAGRINDPRKNIGLLLDALALARRSGTALTLKLTGEPDVTLREKVKEKGLDEVVTFTGFLTPAQLPEFYRSLDVFALPSHQEGFGIVGVEALASGLPIVSTRCGGPEDYVQDGVNGYLVDHDAKAMAESLTQIVADRPHRSALSHEARRMAEERYGLGPFAQTVGDVWESVWGDRP